MRTVDRIEREIEALEREKLRLLTQPEDVYQAGDVVWFTKQFGGGGTVCTYAAVKVGNRWYVTQRGDSFRRGFGLDCLTWDRLLEFIGDGELWAATEWERVQ